MKEEFKELLQRSEKDIIYTFNQSPKEYCEYAQILSSYQNEADSDTEVQFIAFLSEN